MRFLKVSNVMSTGLLAVALIPWLPWSCQQKPAPPPPPPMPTYFDLGEKYFDAGVYDSAVESYNLYLLDNPSAENQDRVLFRLALAHSFPESPVNNPPRATEFLQRLVQSFPQSSYTPQATLLLQLQNEADQLRAAIQQRTVELQQLHQELERLRQNTTQAEIEKLRLDVSRREERIRQLTQELEKLKQIDMQRRPSPLPP